MPYPLFDDSLSALITTLRDLAGDDFVQAGTVLRDASGRLSFVANREPVSEEERATLGDALIAQLGEYARKDRPIAFRGDMGADPVLISDERIPFEFNGAFYNLLDRRIVGAGWLDAPSSIRPSPPRIVFATLKGGVGRSTALTVAAADFARRGRNILVIDLDLEAPGLGDLLIEGDRVPELGAIDYLVENGLDRIPDSALNAFVGTSGLTDPQGGRVDVLPALGRRSMRAPENILPKLSRAMIEDIVDGKVVSVATQISDMITRITEREAYDAVFIDSRAGLAELAASTLLGLGATVLLFGTAQKQTVEGYRALFAALKLLAQRDVSLGRDTEWRTKLRPVYAKAGLNPEVTQRYLDDMYDLFSEYIYDEEVEGTDDDAEALRFARDDSAAPHWPLIVPFSQNFIDFDPSRLPDQLTESFYDQAYRNFLDGLATELGWGKTIGSGT